MEALDVLAVVAHPDDAELLCGGSLIQAEYGEPFWTRETMEAPSLGTLPVSNL
jgi:hypothetical protein